MPPLRASLQIVRLLRTLVASYRYVPQSDAGIEQLLTSRCAGWEYLLYAGALVIGIDSLEPRYGDYLLSYAPRLGTMIAESEFPYFLNSQLGEVQVIVDSLNIAVRRDIIEDALGAPGEAGDPGKILHAASRIIRLYGDMLDWAERIRGLALPSEYRRVIEVYARFVSQPIDELRAFARRFAEQVDDIPIAIAENRKIVIEEVITFTIGDDIMQEYSQAMAALRGN